MNSVTPEVVAEWMLEKIEQEEYLYQENAAQEILERFGSEFTYENENGNLAIDKRVLRVFRKLSETAVVWDRWDRMWRKRTTGDSPARQQE